MFAGFNDGNVFRWYFLFLNTLFLIINVDPPKPTPDLIVTKLFKAKYKI